MMGVLVFRLIGTQQWSTMNTHSNKTSCKLTVLQPDTTYQVKVLTQCLSKLYRTNDMISIRTPEGCEFLSYGLICNHQKQTLTVSCYLLSESPPPPPPAVDDVVPDPPTNLQLSCLNKEDGTVKVSWDPPSRGHGLIREYIVRDSQT